MVSQHNFKSRLAVFLGATMVLLATAAVAFWAAGNLALPLSGFTAWRLAGGGIAVMGSLIGAGLALSNQSGDDDPISPKLFWVFLLTLAFGFLEVTLVLAHAKPVWIFFVEATGHGCLAGMLLLFGIRSLRLVSQRDVVIALVPPVLVCGLIIAKVAFGALLPLARAEQFVAMTTQGSLALLPVWVAGLLVATPGLRRDPGSIFRSLLAVFVPRASYHYQTRFFYSLVAIGLVPLITYSQLVPSASYGQLPVTSICLYWLPCLVYMVLNYSRGRAAAHTQQNLLAMTPRKAVRFFLRHNKLRESSWAATVGLRTASFVIDHDPNNDAPRRLTATLGHIRRDEISSFAMRILGESTLSLKSVGNQLIGTIDPEESSRPCVDILTMFACVYLDVMPLVERRLKCLAALFPIVDPELADKIQPHSIEESHAKMEWLYHLDYSWVDQQLVLREAQSHYSVTMDGMNPQERNHVLKTLQEKNRLGNFIWLGERARERIAMEAPILASVIEAWPIAGLTESAATGLIYLIKYEDLIPRLQKYYSLEKSRAILRDYEINADAKRILNMISLQFNRPLDYRGIEGIISNVTGYRWQGFKEKDAALNIVIKAFHAMKALAADSTQQTPPFETWQQLFLKAIDLIGYPSQLLHKAHLAKRAIRDLAQIISICRDPKNPRFAEAWLYTCSADPKMYSHAEVLGFYEFLKDTLATATAMRNPLVGRKLLEAFLNFAAACTDADHALINHIYLQIADHMLLEQTPANRIAMLLDGKIYLENHLSITIALGPIRAKMSAYLDALVEVEGETVESRAVRERWQSLAPDQDMPIAG